LKSRRAECRARGIAGVSGDRLVADSNDLAMFIRVGGDVQGREERLRWLAAGPPYAGNIAGVKACKESN